MNFSLEEKGIFSAATSAEIHGREEQVAWGSEGGARRQPKAIASPLPANSPHHSSAAHKRGLIRV